MKSLMARERNRFAALVAVALCLTVLLGWMSRSVLIPTLMSLFLTYLLSPIVNRIERSTKLGRNIIVAVLVALTFGLMVFGVVRLVPVVYEQISHVVSLIPLAFQLIEVQWLPWLRELIHEFGFQSIDEWMNTLSLTEIIRQVGMKSGAAVGKIWGAAPQIAVYLVTLSLIPVITFFLLADIKSLKSTLTDLVPPDVRPLMRDLMKRFNSALSAVIVGQIIVASVMGVIYMIGFSVIGLSSALIIGAIAGLCRLVPYLDVVVGSALCAVVVLTDFQNWIQVIAVVCVFVVAQLVDAMMLTPRIIGTRAGLHPGLVILSMFVLSDWFGIWGVLLAVPFVALLRVVVVTYVELYRSSNLYSGHR